VGSRITLITYRFSHILIERGAEQLGGQPQACADEAPRRRDFGDQRLFVGTPHASRVGVADGDQGLNVEAVMKPLPMKPMPSRLFAIFDCL
jgi:hypothetical protein